MSYPRIHPEKGTGRTVSKVGHSVSTHADDVLRQTAKKADDILVREAAEKAAALRKSSQENIERAITAREVKRQAAIEAQKNTSNIVNHPSKKASRRAALRQAGMGKHGGREQLPDKPLRSGSRSPQGDPGVRTEVRSTDTGRTVHHDPYGHKANNIPPHYGVDTPGGTTHHTYPTTHNPQLNR